LNGILSIITDESSRLAAVNFYIISATSFPENIKLNSIKEFDRIMNVTPDFNIVRYFCPIMTKMYRPYLGFALLHFDIDLYPELFLILGSIYEMVDYEKAIERFVMFPKVSIADYWTKEKIYERNNDLFAQFGLYQPEFEVINTIKFGRPSDILKIIRFHLVHVFFKLRPCVKTNLISHIWDREDATAELDQLGQTLDLSDGVNLLLLLAFNPVKCFNQHNFSLLTDISFGIFLDQCLPFRETTMRNVFDNAIFEFTNNFIESNHAKFPFNQMHFIIRVINLAFARNNTILLKKLVNFAFTRNFGKMNSARALFTSFNLEGLLAEAFINHIGFEEPIILARVLSYAIISNNQNIRQVWRKKFHPGNEEDLMRFIQFPFSLEHLKRCYNLFKIGYRSTISKTSEHLSKWFPSPLCTVLVDRVLNLFVLAKFCKFCIRVCFENSKILYQDDWDEIPGVLGTSEHYLPAPLAEHVDLDLFMKLISLPKNYTLIFFAILVDFIRNFKHAPTEILTFCSENLHDLIPYLLLACCLDISFPVILQVFLLFQTLFMSRVAKSDLCTFSKHFTESAGIGFKATLVKNFYLAFIMLVCNFVPDLLVMFNFDLRFLVICQIPLLLHVFFISDLVKSQ